jgi:hypothetical protein
VCSGISGKMALQLAQMDLRGVQFGLRVADLASL